MWSNLLPHKVLYFCWKTINKGLPLRVNLSKKGYQIVTRCLHGCDAQETKEHLFKECQFARCVWFDSRLNLRADGITSNSMIDWTNHLMAENRSRKKTFSLYKRQEGRQQTICHFIMEYDQDVAMATLRCIRLFIEHYGRDNMDPITAIWVRKDKAWSDKYFGAEIWDICNVATTSRHSFLLGSCEKLM
ncbi:reverse transcriptase [Senna tora]|uniref:Reverse transcriptase n=1 Tax=Senna tora TaxID=362788 RepID=A0A835CJ20_9FABA|nr:reverse transcriptase [Senna tora]